MGRLALSLSLLLLPVLAWAQAAPPPLLQLQGRLTDNAGQPITSTTRDLRVEFWDAALGGTSLGASNVVDPAITNGIYAVALSVPAGVFANNATVFMETSVGDGAAGADGAFEVLSPRIRVLAAAYSLNADTLDGLDSASFAPVAGTFVQGGNSFGAPAALGTNDAFDLVLETGGTERARVDAAGAVSLQGNTLTFANPFGSGTVTTLANAAMTVTSAGAGTLFLAGGATGSIRMQTGGADSLFIDGAGNVGIGTTGPSVKLQVVGQTRSSSFSSADGTQGTPAYRFESDADVGMFRPGANTLAFTTGGAERMRFDGAGFVGIGTPAPNEPLEVATSTGGRYVMFRNTTAAVPFGFRLISPDRDWIMQESEGGTPAGSLSIVDNTASTVRMNFSTTGDVAIGAPSPTARLHVRGPANDNLDVRFESDGFSQLLFRSDANADTGGPYNWGVITRPDAGGRFEIRELAVPEPAGNRFVILPGGNVGIGTITPGARLEVVSGPTTDTLGANGASDGFDISEAISSADDVEAGDLVSADPSTSQSVVKSRTPYDPAILGVITSKPAIAIGSTDGNRHIALAGRVAVKVTGENGPVRRGDHLTSSSRPGYAMKAAGPGRVVGVALGEFDGEGEGKVVVYIGPGWWDGGRTAELESRLAEVERENSDLLGRLERLEGLVERLAAGQTEAEPASAGAERR